MLPQENAAAGSDHHASEVFRVGLFLMQVQLRAIARPLEALAVERFQKIIDRVDVECPNRVFVMCGNENDCAGVAGIQRGQDVEAVTLRHAYIEEDEIRTFTFQELDSFFTVHTLTDDGDFRITAKHLADERATERFVFDNDSANQFY